MATQLEIAQKRLTSQQNAGSSQEAIDATKRQIAELQKNEPKTSSQPGLPQTGGGGPLPEPQTGGAGPVPGPKTASMPGTKSSKLLPGAPTAKEAEQRSELVEGVVKKTLTDPMKYLQKDIPGALQTSKDIKVKPGETLDPTGKTFQVKEKVTTGDTATGKADKDVKADKVKGQTYKEALVGKGASGTAAQANLDLAASKAQVEGVSPEELVSYQMEQLTQGLEDGNIPVWARPAVDAVEAQLAARGLSRSSVGAASLSNAIIQAAMPMAQANAQTYFSRKESNLNRRQQTALQNSQNRLTLATQNLSNKQQMKMQNVANRQQAMLSDQASKNAARQFNATSKNQADQFMSSLQATIDQNNAARVDAMTQFNVGQKNAMKQFNEQSRFAREQFNVTNSTQIAQSNVQWRRQVNQINTASKNAVNQANAMNAFNLSNQALTNMWQEMRDSAKWSFEASENDLQRAAALAQAALGNEAATDAKRVEQFVNLGKAALNFWLES